MDLQNAMMASASGLRAQSVRMRVVAENLANGGTVAPDANTDPYRRKIVTFQTELDRASGMETVKVGRLAFDKSDFGVKYDPGNPAADEAGYIKTTNVVSLVELMDMKQAQRSYESNLNALEASKRLASQTLELLRF